MSRKHNSNQPNKFERRVWFDFTLPRTEDLLSKIDPMTKEVFSSNGLEAILLACLKAKVKRAHTRARFVEYYYYKQLTWFRRILNL